MLFRSYACTSRDPQDMCGMQGDDRAHAEGIHSTPLEPQSSDTSADRASCERQGQQCIVSVSAMLTAKYSHSPAPHSPHSPHSQEYAFVTHNAPRHPGKLSRGPGSLSRGPAPHRVCSSHERDLITCIASVGDGEGEADSGGIGRRHILVAVSRQKWVRISCHLG